MAANPMFEAYTPPGWVDFRGMKWPSDWRAGLFVSCKDPSKWKVIVGNKEAANSCARTLSEMRVLAEIIPPHFETTVTTDDTGAVLEMQTPVSLWQVKFEVKSGN